MAKGSSGKQVKSDAMGAKPSSSDGARRANGSQVHGGGRQSLHPSAAKKGR